MPDQFTFDGYRSLIEAFSERGYEAVGYDKVKPDRRHLIVRHDVDMSLHAAEQIAELENKLGVSAFYFVLLRSEIYNLLSPAAEQSIKRIVQLGHQIGLHFDASHLEDDIAQMDQAVTDECRILESLAGTPVQMVSFHRPAKKLLGYPELLGGRHHAYEPKFFNDIAYVSDSRGRWHHGHPLEHPAVAKGHALQLLTHPIWWTQEEEASPENKLERFMAGRIEELHEALAANCETYKPPREDAARS